MFKKFIFAVGFIYIGSVIEHQLNMQTLHDFSENVIVIGEMNPKTKKYVDQANNWYTNRQYLKKWVREVL